MIGAALEAAGKGNVVETWRAETALALQDIIRRLEELAVRLATWGDADTASLEELEAADRILRREESGGES